MLKFRSGLGLAAALGALTMAAQPAQAVVYGVKSIVISNPLDSWLQIAEFELLNTALVNVALSSNGATVTNTGGIWSGTPGAFDPSGPYSGPLNAIDGIRDGQFGLGHIFHPATESGTSLTVTLASVQTIYGLSIFGRTDSSQNRNYFNFKLYDENGALILDVGNLDATNPAKNYSETVTFLSDYGTPPAVPEPATWAMMIGGMGLVGAALRRRKVAVRFA